jgi:hypothetical protein
MIYIKIIVLTLAAILIVAAAFGVWAHSRDRAQARAVWGALEAGREAAPPVYDPAMVAGLPEIVQRYFARAIEPGTPLRRIVRLGMEGTFILNGNEMPMTARQILAPPAQGFVWQAEVGSGLMRFGGSDGYRSDGAHEESWTKFWLRGLIPLARIGGTDDHARAAATRVMMEAIWVPATMLPQFGAEWVQTGPDSAEVRFAASPGLEPMRISFDAEGAPLEVVALRWTDANPDKAYRLQPFGGRILEMGRHAGFLIPTRVEMGNMFGTPDYTPFFFATITSAEF